jgi:hypothetical protein
MMHIQGTFTHAETSTTIQLRGGRRTGVENRNSSFLHDWILNLFLFCLKFERIPYGENSGKGGDESDQKHTARTGMDFHLYGSKVKGNNILLPWLDVLIR